MTIDCYALSQLQDAWQNKELVIFLGAGMSLPYGVPNWRDLVMQLVLDIDEEYKFFWPEYRCALADWMQRQFDFNLLALSRVVKSILKERGKSSGDSVQQFATEVRKRLYSRQLVKPGGDSALAVLANLMKSAWSKSQGPFAIVTFNFDNLLEQELSHVKVPFTTVYNESCVATESVPILHPHGFLPDKGKIEHPPLVFSEDEYHQLAHTPFHWGIVEMLTYLRRYTVLFLGLSMSDPTLRRLLDATAQTKSSSKRRFLVKREYEMPVGPEYDKAITAIENQAAEYRKKTGRGQNIKNRKQLESAVKYMTEHARACDQRLFEDMGVGMITIKDYKEMPEILREIGKGT